MSERKVLNKYYPPDFDPSRIPRMKLPKNRQYTVRLMAPFNMRCKTCGEYIYKGKKFNARKEDVEGQDYLGIRIYRFYIKCTRCLQEISFKTDPQNTDYEIEAGATRNFMALKLAEEQAQREEDERKEEEATNPMKLLENRTQQSKNELELLESLEELKDLNRRQQSVDYDSMLSKYNDKEAMKRLAQLQEEEDEKLIQSIYGSSNKGKRVLEEEIIEEIDADVRDQVPKKTMKVATSSAAPKGQNSSASNSSASNVSWNKSVGMIKKGSGLGSLVRKKENSSAIVKLPTSSGSCPPVSKPSPCNSTLPAAEPSATTSGVQATSGLSLLGTYSDSGSDNDSS